MDSEDKHYDFCVLNNRPYLHFACPNYQWNNMMTIEKLNEIEAWMNVFITKVATSDNANEIQELWSSLPQGDSTFGILDYIALSDVPLGAEAAYKLGYRADKPPRIISNSPEYQHLHQVHKMKFIHPNINKSIYYEDYNNQHNFCKLWHALQKLSQ